MGEVVEAPEQKDSPWMTFLGMIASGVLSLFIAFVLFWVDVAHENRAAERELQGLTHLFAVEAVDVYAESVKRSHQLLVGNRHRDMFAPFVVDAANIGQALSLEADPRLAANIRSVQGRREELRGDFVEAYEFYREKKTFRQRLARRIVDNCTRMRGEVDEILAMARDAGVEAGALDALAAKIEGAAPLAQALAAHAETFLPDLGFSRTEYRMGTYSGNGPKGCELETAVTKITNHSDAPVRITGATTTLSDGSWSDYQGKPVVGREIKPDETLDVVLRFPRFPAEPRGPFVKAAVIETDCPGYERVEMPVTGSVELVHVAIPAVSWSREYSGEYVKNISVHNMSQKPFNVTRVSCTLPGVVVKTPKGTLAAPAPRDSEYDLEAVKIVLEYPKDAAPKGEVEGELVIETDMGGYEKITRKVVFKAIR